LSRARNIKPGFFRNEDLAECDPMARLLFVGLWTLADRNGNLEDRPKRIKGEVFPYDNCDIESLLGQLIARGLVVRYQAEGRPYITIPRFSQHQNPHHSERPQHPKPPRSSPGETPEDSSSSRADSLLLIPESLSTDSVAPAPFSEFWKAYPKKVAKPAAQKAWSKCAGESEAILADLKRRIWPDPQFIPNPATYLNQRRWEDESVGAVVRVVSPEEREAADRRAAEATAAARLAGAKRLGLA
jgi:hypothetical protein